MLARTVDPETLDGLAADVPAAQRSRRDLRWIHRAMGTRAIVRCALRDITASRRAVTPLRILELGAGDGSLMLGVARTLALSWPKVELTLLDRQPLVGRSTVRRYAQLGWTVNAQVGDVFDWAASSTATQFHGSGAARWDVIVANLFLHHFDGAPLAGLLAAVATRTDRFFACEPRRDWLALAASHLVGAIGANAVTREDAVLSVHAGFRGDELSKSWPVHGAEWQLREYSAGLFSHCFRAERLELD